MGEKPWETTHLCQRCTNPDGAPSSTFRNDARMRILLGKPFGQPSYHTTLIFTYTRLRPNGFKLNVLRSISFLDWHNFQNCFCSSSTLSPIMQNAVMHATMTRIGFTEAAAQALVEEQGIDTLDEMRLMTDEEIESLCKVLCRPGGMICTWCGTRSRPSPEPGSSGQSACRRAFEAVGFLPSTSSACQLSCPGSRHYS